MPGIARAFHSTKRFKHAITTFWPAACSPAIPAPQEAAELLRRLHAGSTSAVVADVLAAFGAGASDAQQLLL